MCYFFVAYSSSWFGVGYEKPPEFRRRTTFSGEAVVQWCVAPYRIDKRKSLGVGDTVYVNDFGWGVVLELLPNPKNCR